MKLTRIAAGIVAATTALALSACGGGNAGSDKTFDEGTTMAKLVEAGSITIGTKFDQPLFGLMGPDGTPEGFDVEIGKIIAGELGLSEDNINWVETVSQNREPFIQNGQVDIVVATYTINDTRKEVIDFAGPYYIAGQSFLVPSGNPMNISDPADLGDATICTVTGSTSEKNIAEYTDKIITVDKYSDCLEPIRTGQADALTTDNVILAGLVSQNGDEFEVVDDTFTSEPYGIGLAKGDDEFRAFINDTLQAAYNDGRWEEAWTATAGTVLPTPEPPELDRY
ncbi:glutamate ABC transporter substrate-binding protein [Propionimicrobium sp. PCR01-08-3]|uniref:glutamate ABC transporter substrate-binding protein n=1 Tax=Propionimicrobium sp. PCR01-08-3 TaxID=3052086 RepID=UPI00255C3445|nr:glutamate ABC transporter substrate-binding protein [Propionimicrobium sp. PCR01-08-3]WIY81865.1 glutamate ABC transporter substrate-binding protein [Propionimicrobium sp. PCR01-08-3]